MHFAKARQGIAMLEVIIALSILGIAGVAVSGLAADSARAVRHAAASERDMRRANAFMNAVALWSAQDLDRRLGARRQGPWRLQIDRVSETLYTVSLSDSTSGRLLLVTSLYRPTPSAIEEDDAR